MTKLVRRNDERDPVRAGDVWDPFRMLDEMFRGHPLMRWMDSSLSPPLRYGALSPAFEVKERDDAYVIEADLPGMKEDDLDVTITGNRLTVSGRREETREAKKESYYTYERQYGSFSRSFSLPEGVDYDHIDADLDRGVLSIVVPKTEAAQPRKISLTEKIKRKLKGAA